MMTRRDTDWVEWDQYHIGRMYALLTDDADVWAAASIRLDYAINGGIQFKLSGYWELSEEELEIIKPFWLIWKKEAIISIWTTGFFATVLVTEPQTKLLVPKLLDLRYVRVQVKYSPVKLNKYRFFTQTGKGKSKQISNVFWQEVGLVNRGMPHSLIQSLHAELQRVCDMTRYSLRASDARSRSVMVTQDQKNQNAADEMMHRDERVARQVIDTFYQADITPADNASGMGKQDVALGNLLSSHVDMLNSASGFKYQEQFMQVQKEEAENKHIFDRVRIGQHNIQRHVPPTPPDDLINQIQRKQTIVFAVFRVPVGMISGQSSLNRSALNQNAMTVFNAGQRALDQSLLPMCRQLFRACCLDRAMEQVANSMEEDEKESEMTVSFPLMLPWDSMQELYNAGFLTNDAMREYVQTRFGIAEHAMTTDDKHKTINVPRYKNPGRQQRQQNPDLVDNK